MIANFVQNFRPQVHIISLCEYFFGNSPMCFAKYSSSEFLSKNGLWFFDYKIWKTISKNIQEFFAKQSVSIALLFTFMFFLSIIITLKVFYQPIHEFYIGINDRKANVVVIMLTLLTISTLQINANTTFSINNSSHITQLINRPHSELLYDLNMSMDIIYHKREINNTLNDLTSGSLLGYAKVLTHIESMRGNAEELSRQIEYIWSLKSKRMLYVAINQQVTLQNQDPICNKIQHGVYKSSLIDLEAYGNSYGDRAQAQAA